MSGARRSMMMMLACGLVASACGDVAGPQTGGETHWLERCSVQSDCSEGLVCACGLCTTTCDSSVACEDAHGAPALCLPVAGEATGETCPLTADSDGGGFCFAECVTTSDCVARGPDLACVDGTCRAARPNLDWLDAGDASVDADVGGDPELELGPDGGESDVGSGDLGLPQATWYGLGESELGPWTEPVDWGSGFGGGVSQSHTLSVSPSLATDASGRVIVAWAERGLVEGGQIRLREWTGGRWEGLGGSATAPGLSDSQRLSYAPAVAIAPTGEVAVSWLELSGPDVPPSVYLKLWDGTAWRELDGSATGEGIDNPEADDRIEPAVAFDGQGNPIVVWADDVYEDWTCRLRVRRWNGAAWAPDDPPIVPGDCRYANGRPSVVVDSQDRVVVLAAIEPLDSPPGFERELLLFRREAAAWEPLHEGLEEARTYTNAGPPALTLDSDGALVVGWAQIVYVAAETYDSAVHVRRLTSDGWEPVSDSGGPLTVAERAPLASVRLAAGSEGTLAASWRLRQEAHASLWDGEVWHALEADGESGGLAQTLASNASPPRIAIDAEGRPVVAWDDWLNSEILVRRWDGTAWATMAGEVYAGGVNSSTGLAWRPSLAMTANGDPVVAWMQALSDRAGDDAQIHLREWDGARWAERAASDGDGGLSLTATQSYGPRVAVAPDGALGVVWRELPTIYYRTLRDEVWQELGGSASGAGLTDATGVDSDVATGALTAFTPDGRPVVAYFRYAPETLAQRPHVLAWTGDAWSELGGDSLPSLSAVKLQDLAVDGDGRANLLWVGVRTLVVSVWTDRSFRTLAPLEMPVGLPWNPAAARLVFDAEGRPVVSWTMALDGRPELHVARLTGNSWEQLGDALSWDSDDESPNAAVFAPALALDGDGEPIVAWQDARDGPWQIYVRRWDGTGWREIDGSASGGGVSNSRSNSEHAALAYRAGRLCVAWDEQARRGTRILLRCTDLD